MRAGSGQGPSRRRPREAISRPRKLAFLLLYLALLGGFAEAAFRVGYFLMDGFNPYYLRFGFVPDTEFHSFEARGYSKFQPGSVKRQKLDRGVIAMKISSMGFRQTGESDPPGAAVDLRVATLGASSTFGYYVEDHETYPAVLERLLRGTFPDRTVEVYNFGVPHLRIENIVELARHELPLIEPTVVTLYCGYNNVGHPNEEAVGRAVRLKDWLYFHSVLYRAVRPMLKTAYFSFVRTTNRDPAALEHLSLPITLSGEEIETLRLESAADFVVHLEELHKVTEAVGSKLVLVTQNYNLKLRGDSGLDDRWRTYDEEVRFVEALLEAGGGLTAVQASLLVHRDLMNELRIFARKRGLPVVDGIAVMAREPSQMLSGVHLSPLGNQWIAEALHEAIVALLEGPS